VVFPHQGDPAPSWPHYSDFLKLWAPHLEKKFTMPGFAATIAAEKMMKEGRL
jgi:hypothetical protein